MTIIKEILTKGIYSKEKSWGNGCTGYYLPCPCCNYKASTFDLKSRRWGLNHMIYSCFMKHLVCQIRLNGEISHIKLLIELYGKNEAKKILINFAKKNSLVALRLNKIIKKLC